MRQQCLELSALPVRLSKKHSRSGEHFRKVWSWASPWESPCSGALLQTPLSDNLVSGLWETPLSEEGQAPGFILTSLPLLWVSPNPAPSLCPLLYNWWIFQILSQFWFIWIPVPEEQEPFSDIRSMVFKLCSALNFSLEKAMSAVGPWDGWSWVGRWGYTQVVGTGDGVWHLSGWEEPTHNIPVIPAWRRWKNPSWSWRWRNPPITLTWIFTREYLCLLNVDLKFSYNCLAPGLALPQPQTPEGWSWGWHRSSEKHSE